MMKIAALILLVIMYAVMIALPKRRVWAVAATAAAYLIMGILPVSGILPAINWNVLLMMAGTMLIVDYFIAPGFRGTLWVASRVPSALSTSNS